MQTGRRGTPPVLHPFPTGPKWLELGLGLQKISTAGSHSVSTPVLKHVSEVLQILSSPGGKNNVPTTPFWRISIRLTPGAMYQRSVVTAASSVLCRSLGETWPSSKDTCTTNGVSTFFFLSLWRRKDISVWALLQLYKTQTAGFEVSLFSSPASNLFLHRVLAAVPRTAPLVHSPNMNPRLNDPWSLLRRQERREGYQLPS